MSIRIGIDVGGTYTDAVLIRSGQVRQTGKVLTKPDQLLDTVLEALDSLNIASEISPKHEVESITVSTTLVTNAILQKQLPEVELILLPGSGMKLTSLSWPVPYHVLSGELDYRGRQIAALDKQELQDLTETIINKHLENKQKNEKTLAVVSGKFSHRNYILEQQLAAYLQKKISELSMALGSEWGQSNFYRRSLTAYLNLAAQDLFTDFRDGLIKAVRARGLQAPVKILKANGGMQPAENIRPVESIYSGPAASLLGTLAQSNPEHTYIVVDIGGTTTDIGLVLSGKPLLSSRGAHIGDFLTNVHSLAVQSIAVGGDSVVLPTEGEQAAVEGKENKNFSLASYRLGPAYCLGGSKPTTTDALRYLGLVDFGDYARAEEAMSLLLPEGKRETPYFREIAQNILDLMVEKIAEAIGILVKQWRDEPAYKVWQVLNPRADYKFPIKLSGGGAYGLAAALAQRMNATVTLTDHAMVVNAVGAAMAKPTFSWTLNLDTSLKRYRIEETGEQGEWRGSLRPHREVEQFLKTLASKQAKDMGLDEYRLEMEPFDYFPLIEGYRTVGQIVRGRVHLPPGAFQLQDYGPSS
ncbi:MAG: hydantoinase/oxoprolinase family protein [Peptococcaceae bacterium]|nr:hydantoinase/oxoprolinase family protein [Peptococcaceae bacterium]